MQNFLHIVVYFLREQFLTPTYDIDLVWHSHQLCVANYRSAMEDALGYVLDHDDTDQDRQPGSKLNTVSAVSKLSLRGCVERRTCSTCPWEQRK